MTLHATFLFNMHFCEKTLYLTLNLHSLIFNRSGLPQPQRVWVILLSDIILITEYDPMDQNYVVIEEPIRLRHSVLDYEAIAADGSPDQIWKISVDDAAGFGGRKYLFKADTAELAAMWKCSINRQIDHCRIAKVKAVANDSPADKVRISDSSVTHQCPNLDGTFNLKL